MKHGHTWISRPLMNMGTSRSINEFNYKLEQKLAEYKIIGIEYTQAKNQLMDGLRI